MSTIVEDSFDEDDDDDDNTFMQILQNQSLANLFAEEEAAEELDSPFGLIEGDAEGLADEAFSALLDSWDTPTFQSEIETKIKAVSAMHNIPEFDATLLVLAHTCLKASPYYTEHSYDPDNNVNKAVYYLEDFLHNGKVWGA